MKDRWKRLARLEVEDTPSRACIVKMWYYNGLTGLKQEEIPPLYVKQVGRSKAIVMSIYKMCKNDDILLKEALQSLEESYGIK